MITILFLAEWALRSSILILSGALLLSAMRVKDPATRPAAWTAMLCASLAMPLFTAVAPGVPIPVINTASQPAEAPAAIYSAALQPAREILRQETTVSRPFEWARAAVTIYILVSGILLLRLCFGLAMSLRLRCSSRATGHATEGIEIRESDYTASPVALGVVRPVIMLPGDWREWPAAKLNAVLAHERSHIRRRDPAVQLLSAIHRALLWHSPLSWFLHRRIVRVAEEASDDAAVAVTGDRASYAEVLLDFMQRGVRDAEWQGVAMARYGRPEERIHRILDGTALSGGVTRWTVAAILAVGSPLAYLVAAAQTTALGPAFEVADIQMNKSGSAENDVEFLPGGRVSVRNATLRTLIIVAYNVRGNAVKGGPAWLDSDRFDIVAKANPKSSERDLRLMMQTLLAERFKLRVHPDQKVLPVYALKIAAGESGPTLFEAMERQLGLEMVAQKLPIPIVAVDRVERTPTEN